MTAGFPNLFLITGPGSPSVLTNIIMSIEQHVEWIADCLRHMRQPAAPSPRPTPRPRTTGSRMSSEVAGKTLFADAKSWYIGANIPGKPRVFLPYIGGLGNYTVICDEVAADGYRGFRFA